MTKPKTSTTANYFTPAYKFRQQRSSARARGIEWLMTFDEWWGVWQASGKWSQRGHRDGQYVMGRHGDTGPYAVWNVSIITSNENHAVQRSRASGLPLGVSKTRAGNYRAKRRDIHLGTFLTPEQAHQAYLMAGQTEARAA
jgi:hypothetical protein